MTTKQLGTSIASIALLTTVFATPAFADTDLSISGNGSYSDNSVDGNRESNLILRQNNDTNISNDVSVKNNTGFNSAIGNTGGMTNIRTGNASSNVNISNQAGMNVAEINGCCNGNESMIKIEGNGSWSDNRVDLETSKNLWFSQDNDSEIDNSVNVANTTGGNDTSWNTGGTTTIRTGEANAEVNIQNAIGENQLNVSGCCAGDSTKVSVTGNGSGSDNHLSVSNKDSKRIDQNNQTNGDNDVTVNNDTGNNSSNDGFDQYFWSKDREKDYSSSNGNDRNKKYVDRDESGKTSSVWYEKNNQEKDHANYIKQDNTYNKYDKKQDSYYNKNKNSLGKFNSLVKYPEYVRNYNATGYCNDGKSSSGFKPVWYLNPYHGGNTGGDVSVSTGRADAAVNLNNAASSNVLNFL